MKQEQSSLEKGITLKELFFCYNTIQNKKNGATTQEEYDMLVKTELETKWILLDNHKKALANQKQKYKDMLKNSLKLCGYCKHQILKEFEEVRNYEID